MSEHAAGVPSWEGSYERRGAVELDAALARGLGPHVTSDPAIQVPTTIAEFGDALYAVTAGFAPPDPDFVVRLPK